MLRASALALVVAACSTVELEPERVETPLFVAEDGSYRLELPLGWVREGQALTRDGWERQTITFNAGPVLDSADAGAIDPTAPELLQAMQDELAAQSGVQVVECRAATFDGLPGFRLHFRHQESAPAAPGDEPRAQEREHLICGAVSGRTLYAFSLEALVPDFARDLEAFERMVASFERLEGGPAIPPVRAEDL